MRSVRNMMTALAALAMVPVLTPFANADTCNARFIQVAADGFYNCGLKVDGSVRCWGEAPGTPPADTFTQITAGYQQACGIKEDGSVVCWSFPEQALLTPPSGTFTQIAAGWAHTCGLRPDGSIVCWGSNEYGESTPPAGKFTQISAAGSQHNCAIRDDGAVLCWGSDVYGESTPPAGTFTRIAAGGVHACGIRDDGSLTCWGSDVYGQSTPPAGVFTRVSAGDYYTCGIRDDGSLACWGDDSYSQCTPPSGTFAQIAAGWAHACALRPDSSVVCWGDDRSNQTMSACRGCSSAPILSSGCLAAGRSKFRVDDPLTGTKAKLSWQWSSGAAFDQADLGTPLADTTYTLCVYDNVAATPSLALAVQIAPSGLWTSKAPKGLAYKDKAGSSGGVKKASMKTGVDGRTQAKLSAAGPNLALLGPAGSSYFTQDPSIVVQLINNEGACWTSEFAGADTKSNEGDSFRAQAK